MDRTGYWLHKWTDETSAFDHHGRWNGGLDCYERDYSMWIPDRIRPDDTVAVNDYIDKQFELSSEVADGLEVIEAADAQATIAALQARVQELEARQHFGACAKCLTNAWRICKEGTPDAVEMKCSNGSTWWLCDYCSMKIRLAETYRIAQDSENERIELKAQLTQRTAERDTARRRVDELEAREVDVVTLREDLEKRTAELEAAKREVDVWKEKAELRGKEACAQRAELERVSLLSSHNERRFEEVDKKYKELRTLIAALPKVEGAVVVSHGYVKDSTRCHALFGADEDAASYAALLQHRQGMEG